MESNAIFQVHIILTVCVQKISITICVTSGLRADREPSNILPWPASGPFMAHRLRNPGLDCRELLEISQQR